MSYSSVFGGTTIYPSDVSYLALALSASTALEWPLESAGGTPAARIIDVTASGAYNIDLPDATQTGAGQTLLFNNLPASASEFYVRDFDGNTIATVGVGEQWQLYLAGTGTAAGTWRVFRYGASTATVQASALAGYGLTVTAGTLSQSQPVTTFSVTPRTVLDTDRASAFVWTGTGSGTLNLPAVADVGNDFFISIRNSGGGDVTIDPTGSETINGAATLSLRPGDSATLVTNGLAWYSFGLGQEAVFAFDYTSIDLTGETSPYTLSGAELNRIAYKFIGTLTGNMEIVVPPTIQQYWVDNQTTGAFTLTVKTASGTGSSVTQGGRGIYYCDGANVVNASTAGISVPLLPSEGGTGQTSYTIGDILYASGATTLARLADVATGNALISGGVGVAPLWGKIGLTTHVSGTLPVANGGTGATTAPNARTALGATTVGSNIFTLTNPSAITFLRLNADNTVSALNAADFRAAIGVGVGAGTVTSVDASGGTTGFAFTGGPVTTSGTLTLTVNNAATVRTSIGATTVGSNIFTLTNPSAIRFIRINADNTVTARTAAELRSDISAAASGANTDITALDQDVTITATGTIAAGTIGYRGLPQVTATTRTLQLSDAGDHISATGTVTIPANGTTAFPIGTTIVVYNNSSSNISIAITTDTLRLAGTATTGTRTLAQRGLATLVKVNTTEWVVTGNVT